MNIAFYEVQPWEEAFLAPHFASHLEGEERNRAA